MAVAIRHVFVLMTICFLAVTGSTISDALQDEGKLAACMLLVQSRIRQDHHKIAQIVASRGYSHDTFLRKVAALMGEKAIVRLTEHDVNRITHELPLKSLATVYADYTSLSYETLSEDQPLTTEQSALADSLENVLADAYSRAKPTEFSASEFVSCKKRTKLERGFAGKMGWIMAGVALVIILVLTAKRTTDQVEEVLRDREEEVDDAARVKGGEKRKED